MFVGGEFFYDEKWVVETPVFDHQDALFLNGGKACLIVIADYLRSQGIDRILLPTYLCPSILRTLESSALKFSYYRVNEDLSIDLDDIHQKAADCGAVYFINYFGFMHSSDEIDCLRTFQKKGHILIEDNAQAGFPTNHMGDFVFNSMRKFIPYDGAYLFSRYDLSACVEKYRSIPNRRLPLIRSYRQELSSYLLDGFGDREALERKFYLAEYFYDSDPVVCGDEQERYNIEHLDWEGIKQIRRSNYCYLLELICEIPEIIPIFPALQPEIMPLGLPVYFKGLSRDFINEELGNSGISLSIHWDALLQEPPDSLHPLAKKMAESMLTLTIDQRTSHKQMDYLVLTLMQAIEKAKKLN